MRPIPVKASLLAVSWLFLCILTTVSIAGADGAGVHAVVEGKEAQGIEAVLRPDAARSMVDLYLKDAKTGRPIIDAKAEAIVRLPSGREIRKELMGMKMGDAFSYMTTLDMSEKGEYVFDITASHGGRKASFRFSHGVE
jgi:hypothetical protein